MTENVRTNFTRCFVAPALIAGLIAAFDSATGGQIDLPPEFAVDAITENFSGPVAIAFAEDGRLFVAERKGYVWIVEDGVTIVTPFIDLREEINFAGDRGLLGLALDPDFVTNRYVYLLYTVDLTFGQPDESGESATFARITRYQGSKKSGGYVADLSSRTVLIGENPGEGFPACWSSHTVGALHFGLDGTLFASAGDGARFDLADDGGSTPDCFGKSLFGSDQDVGAFRSQYLDSLAGKVIRIDPANGNGLSSNPYWDGNAQSVRSKVWAYGLRNPFRFAVRPNSPLPGTLYIGDVGWDLYEETNISHGGENFGWPCEEGPGPAPSYPSLSPAHSGCDTIETKTNPGTLTGPSIWWHQNDPNLSFPQGILGRTSIAGVFHEGTSYPAPYRGGYFFADLGDSWIKVLKVDESDQVIEVVGFSVNAALPVMFSVHPQTEQVCFVSFVDQKVYCIRSLVIAGDVDRDGDVDVNDLRAVILNWGSCVGCNPDLDGNGKVDVNDLREVILNWSP